MSVKREGLGLKITDEMHFIKCPFSRPGYFTGVCAILGETITLIDSGLLRSPEEAIFPYLKGLGREPEEISTVILTHGHGDHCDGIYTIKKRVKSLKVAVHRLDEPLLRDPTLYGKDIHARFPDFFPPNPKPDHKPLDADILLEDGDRIPAGEHELRVIHAPGHTAGSIVLLEEELSLCVCGDSLQGRGDSRPLLYYSSDEYAEFIKRLKEERIEIMALGHPMPPFRKGVLYDEEVKEHIVESLKAVQELRGKVLETLRSSREPLPFKEIALRLPECRPQSIGCVLESLEASGEVEKIEKPERSLWRIKGS